MKRTTYILIGFVIAGFIVTAAIMVHLATNGIPSDVWNTTVNGDMTESELPAFSKIEFTTGPSDGESDHPSDILGFSFPGVVFEQVDSLSSPKLLMRSGWKDYIGYDLSGDCLTFKFNPLDIETNDDGRILSGTYVASDPIVILVPSGMMKSICNNLSFEIRFKGMTGRLIHYETATRSLFENCEIKNVVVDKLHGPKTAIRLDMKQTHFGRVILDPASHDVRITGDSLSSVGTMVWNVWPGKIDYEIYIGDVDVSEFIWLPSDANNMLVLRTRRNLSVQVGE